MQYTNLAFYQFRELSPAQLPTLRARVFEESVKLSLKGTVLLAHEGVNCFVAGLPENIEHFKSFLAAETPFRDLAFKESVSDEQPFKRMLVKIKKEIITMGCPDISPATRTAKRLKPLEFKNWLSEGRDIVVLDTRNDYEVRLGTFKGAVAMGLKTFRQFPKKSRELPGNMREKPIVAFCTGGIRCEKASALLLDQGFKDVYQLDGGILKYFEEAGGTHFNGECFVFDYRVALDHKLQETDTILCYNCQNPITVEEQKSSAYIPNVSCPYCVDGKTFHKEEIALDAGRL